MKDFIKKLLRETLDEIKTKEKELFGSGDFHHVYRFNRFPDRLFKIGKKETVKEWVYIFKEYPEYFPKIYRVFPYKKDPTLTVVEIEMLDTKTAADEFTKLNNFLENNFDVLSCNNQIITIDVFYEEPCFSELLDFVEVKKPELEDLFYKWAKFLKGVAPTVKNLKRNYLDLHVGNVAYNAQGNLKLIDI